MALRRVLLGSVFAAVVSGCATYPLPHDYTGVRTEDIVGNVRCEARRGLREVALRWLQQDPLAGKPVWRGRTGQQLAAELQAYPEVWATLRVKEMEKDARARFAFYENSRIAYSFTLDMSESNRHTAAVGLERGAPTRTDNLGFGATSALNRSVTRAFTTIDTFGNLVLRVEDKYCARSRSDNIVYPAIGRLPIADLVHAYVQTNEFGGLSGSGKAENIFGTKTSPAIPQMGDTMTFTTRFDGSVDPASAAFKILDPIGAGFLPKSFAFTSSAHREDKHKVDIVLYTSPDAAKAGGSLSRVPFGPYNPNLPPSRVAAPRGAGSRLTDAQVDYGMQALRFQRSQSLDSRLDSRWRALGLGF